MKSRIVFCLLALMVFHALQAQIVVQPTDPNENCQQAWQDYKKADKLWKTGWGLFGAGAGMTVAGCISWSYTSHSWTGWEGNTWAHPGFLIMCLGGGTFLASIPCLAVGQTRRKTAMKMYDEYNCTPKTCEQLKADYKKANVLWKTGWGLFGAGTGLMFAGCIAWRFTLQGGRPPEEQDPGMTAVNNACFSFMIIGAGATVASVPCLAVGQARRKATLNTYQKNCSSDAPITFSIQTSSNGLGLAMRF